MLMCIYSHVHNGSIKKSSLKTDIFLSGLSLCSSVLLIILDLLIYIYNGRRLSLEEHKTAAPTKPVVYSRRRLQNLVLYPKKRRTLLKRIQDEFSRQLAIRSVTEAVEEF